jgi:hypothetical protein
MIPPTITVCLFWEVTAAPNRAIVVCVLKFSEAALKAIFGFYRLVNYSIQTYEAARNLLSQ